jgi:tetratricopeptide (TPR) repeat protein
MATILELLHQGLAAQRKGDLETAAAHYLEVIRLDPRQHDAYHLLGNVYRAQGLDRQAIIHIQQAIGLAPQQSMFYNSLGNCYLDSQGWVAAELCYRRALDLDPNYVNAAANLGMVLFQQQRHSEALTELSRALSLEPDNLFVLCNLGKVHHALQAYDKALPWFERALALNGSWPEARLGAAQCAFQQGRLEAALQHLDSAALDTPRQVAEAMQLKGNILQSLGRFDEAAAALDAGLEASPGNISLAYTRANLVKVRAGDRFYDMITAGAQHLDEMVGNDLATYCYTLGKVYQDTQEIDKAAAVYARGATAQRSQFPSDEADLEQLFRITRQAMDGPMLKKLGEGALESERPLFILGMPRSGTTLTEQILASHPQVFAGGELEFWPMALNNFQIPGHAVAYTHGHAPEYPTTMTLPERARIYLDQLESIAGAASARYITDKMPGNYMTLGLIAAAFPNARIIHCRRDPIDTAVSCYTTRFATGNHWSFDLETLGRQFRRYWDLMAHWRAVLPNRFIEIRYEDMVEDQEGSARRLLEWCQLDWHERVLDFHKTQRAVRTASVSQVRQPIYSTSIGRWKQWEPYIQPLIDEIADLERAYWAEVGQTVQF